MRRQSFLSSLVAGAVLVAGIGLSVVVAPTSSAAPVFTTACFTSPKVEKALDYTVPAGVTTVRAILSGQNGGGSAPTSMSGIRLAGEGSKGGSGSTLVVDVAVTPGQVLQIGRLKGAPAGAAGWSATSLQGRGGIGGDAQYLSTVGSDGCQHGLAVAGAGGGGGGSTARGGDADAGSGAKPGANGGTNREVDGGGGGGGGANSGGNPGAAGYATFNTCSRGNAGQWGVFLNDGKGGDVGRVIGDGAYNCGAYNLSGGGGGGGWWYGGGGGSSYTAGDGLDPANHPGAGGGGSSYVHPSVTKVAQSVGPTYPDPVIAPVYDTATTVTTTPTWSTAGQEVVITARVTVPSLGRPVPAGGTVEFSTGAGVTKVPVGANGEAVLRTGNLPQGWNDVRATYPAAFSWEMATRGSSSGEPVLRHEVRACAPAPVFRQQPIDDVIVTGRQHTLDAWWVESSVYGSIPVMSWESSRDGGATWQVAEGEATVGSASTQLVVPPHTRPETVLYRVTATTCGGRTISNQVTVTVMGARFDLSTLPPKTYGDTFDISGYAQAVTQPARSIVFSSKTAESCTVSGSTVTVTAAGLCTIGAKVDPMTPNGYPAEALQSFTAKPKALTVTAKSFDHPRNSPAPAFGCTAPFLGSDTWVTPPTHGVYRQIVTATDIIYRPTPNWASLTGTYSYFTTRCYGGTVDANYTIAGYKDGALRIVAPLPVPVKVTAASPTVSYGSAAPEITAAVGAGLVGTLSCSAYATTDTAFASPLALSSTTPAGRYTTHCSGLTNPTGPIAYVDGTLTVTPAVLTVTASSPETGAHGVATAPAITCTTTGFLGSDRFTTEPRGRSSNEDGVVVIDATTPVGSYATTCAGGDAGSNYSITSVPGTFLLEDRSGPVVAVPATVVAEPTSVSGAVVTYAAPARDAVDGPVDGTCAPASGTVFPIGDTTVTCSAVDAVGNTGRAAFTVSVKKIEQTVAFTSPRPARPVALGSFTPSTTGGASGLPVVIGATGACSVADGVVTFTRSGMCTVTAEQAGDAHYASDAESFDLTVAKATQTITPVLPARGVLGSTDVVSATASSGLPVVISTFFGCTVAPDGQGRQILTYTEGNTCAVQFDVAGDDVHEAPDSLVRFILLDRIPQAITFTSTPPARVFTDDTYTVQATGGGSGNPLEISIIENGNCTIEYSTVTFFGDGYCTVKVDQRGDERHSAAPQARQVITVGTPEGNLRFGGEPPRIAKVLETYTPVIVPGPSSGVPVLSASGACSLMADGTTVRNDKAGLCRMALDQPGDGYWPARRAEADISVVKLEQTVRITTTPPVNAAVGGTYTPAITAGASGTTPWIITSVECSVKDGVVTFSKKGICLVAAYQNGTEQYENARPDTQSIEVGYAPGSVGISSPVPTGAAVGGSVTPVLVRGPSTGPALLAASGACSLGENGVVSYDSAGTCTVVATHYRDDTYGTARAVQTFEIAKLPQTVVFTSTAPATALVDATYRPTADGRASGSAVVIGATGSCAIADGLVTFTGAGTCTITADQAGDDRYSAAPQVSQRVAVGLVAGTVAFGGDAPAEARVGGSSTVAVVAGPSSAPPVLTASGACSVGPFRLVSYDAAGTCTLTLNQAGDARHGAAPEVVRTFEITTTAQVVAFTSQAPASALAGGTYRPTATGGASGRPVQLGATGSCSIASGVVTFTGSGTCTVTADQPGGVAYSAAPQVSQTIAVGLTAGTVAFGGTAPVGAKVGGSSTPRIVAGPSSARPVLTASGACSVSAGVVSYDTAGTCALTLNQAGDAVHAAAPEATRTFEIAALAQTLTFTSDAPESPLVGGTYRPTVAGGASSGPVVLGVTGSCAIADGVVTFTGSGSCTITADRAGDARYAAAAQVSQTVEIGVSEGTVAFGGVAPADARFGGSFTPVIVRGPSSAAPVLAASGACSVDSGVVSYDAVGTCTLTLDQPGDAEHGPADQVVRAFEVGKAVQTVAFTSEAPAAAVAGGTYTPTATGGPSSEPVVFGTEGSCSIEDGVVTFSGSGTCTVTADQAGDDTREAAPRVSQTIAVGLTAGTVSFGGTAPADARVGGSSTPVIVRGPSSADPVLTASGACSTASGVVSYDSAGSCTLTVDQAGDPRHGAAQAVRTFEVAGRRTQTVAFTSTAPAATAGGAVYVPTVAAGGSSAPVVLGTTTSTVCSVTNGTVKFVKAGTCKITASQAGDASYEAATRATQSVAVVAPVKVVKKAQTIAFTTTMPTSPDRGIAYPVAAAASSGLPVTLTASGSCTLAPTGSGTATVTLTGTSSCTVTAAQAGDSVWSAAPAVKQTLQMKLFTRADLTVAVAPAAGLSATAPLSVKVTVKNVGTRDAAATTTRVVVTGTVASAPGAVKTAGSVAGTTVLTWKTPSVTTGKSIVYTVTLASRPASTTVEAKAWSVVSDPTPGNNIVKRTLK
ncbi:HYR domain-containing protein [Rathayibacter caricis]|uniref:MBG domain-containing protein n=1 Tax=Rathayibacter caricis TaxID=110936 RepID=UPI001FB4D45A|nr:MBG domain-containing protein [Rathayibacter caricis]MCJ1696547.1 HYR domain-containing protein [Rathayibacter caricis]